jgi:hypothetical protein
MASLVRHRHEDADRSHPLHSSREPHVSADRPRRGHAALAALAALMAELRAELAAGRVGFCRRACYNPYCSWWGTAGGAGWRPHHLVEVDRSGADERRPAEPA